MNHHPRFSPTPAPEVAALDAADARAIVEAARAEFAALKAVNALTVRGYPAYPAYVGLDLSMTSTGLAVHTTSGPYSGWTDLHRIDSKPEDWATGPWENLRSGKSRPSTTWTDRLGRMMDIVNRIDTHVPDGSLVFLEAPSYGSTGSGTFDRSGLWWLAYARLSAMGGRVIPVSPSQRMLYATGKGGGKDAGKDAVIAAVVRRYPDLAVTDNNVADAVVLLAMARRAAGDPMDHENDRHPSPGYIPKANLKAMDKLEAVA